ncbi:hypothetical protein J3A83DRAFT_4375546 [Scleroderma citrinum]
MHWENDILEDLGGLFSQDQICLLKKVLGSLEIEAAVQVLLRQIHTGWFIFAGPQL